MPKPRKEPGSLGPLEAAIMEAVWGADGPVAVRAVVERLNTDRPEPLAYTTVMTVMTRLAKKGFLYRRKHGRGFVYEAVAPDAAGLAVKEVLAAHGDAAVAHFLDEARADPEVMARLRAIIGQADG
jgi:predicted transcriptional regulator